MAKRFLYPSLPAVFDLGFVRIGGWGLGNCLFVYFHAFIQAQENGQCLVAPAWHNFQIGPWLRGERSLRRYGSMFHRHRDEIGGLRKALLLLTALVGSAKWPWGTQQQSQSEPSVDIYTIRSFTFLGLHDHRAAIRERLNAITHQPESQCWGKAEYASIHVRLGDFAVATPEKLRSGTANMRIPISWYAAVARRLRDNAPNLAIRVYSDGEEAELAELLEIDGVRLHRESTDIGDLLALARACVLVGSNSTFSQWAAFLGDMPTIWFASEAPRTAFGRPDTAMLAVGDDMCAIDTITL